MATAAYLRQQELAREHGYESIYFQTKGRAEAREFLEERGLEYTPAEADAINAFAREHEAGTLTRDEMRAWFDENIGGSDDDFYDWLRDWTDSGETQ